ncbi:hypothetical protein PM082_013805 [Marasmius tenuissimus]|nr:hypothetical protein PM082_013805 [Marasmius tenuissimus]
MEPNSANLLQTSLDCVRFIEDYLDQGSPHDLENIAQYLPAIQYDIARLEKAITELKPASTLLENHRKRLNRSIVKGRSLIPPPVHRLPSKVLSHIFAFVCEDPLGSKLSARIRDPLLDPVQLSMVCGSWRENTISTSTLWSSVTFISNVYRALDVAEGERLHRMTEIFMTRARTSPLTIRFSCWDKNPAGSRYWPIQDYSRLQSRSGGIVHALVSMGCRRIGSRMSFPLLPAIQSIRGNLSNLHKIGGVVDTLLSLAHIFGYPCPALRTIKIGCLGVQEGHTQLVDILPWQQIESLVLPYLNTNLGARSHLDLVSFCPELKSLNILQDTVTQNKRIPDNRYHLTSNLESLTLTLVPEPSTLFTWVPLIDHLSLPRLSSLTLYHVHPSLKDASPLFQCITRSACPITSLTLAWDAFSSKDNLRLLSHTPQLAALTLFGPRSSPQLDRTQDFLRILYNSTTPTIEREIPRILTRLQHLTFGLYLPQRGYDFFRSLFDSSRDIDDITVYRTVASRWRPDRKVDVQAGVGCLRSVTIELPIKLKGSDCRDVPDLEKLRDLGEEGLEVFIIFPGLCEPSRLGT